MKTFIVVCLVLCGLCSVRGQTYKYHCKMCKDTKETIERISKGGGKFVGGAGYHAKELELEYNGYKTTHYRYRKKNLPYIIAEKTNVYAIHDWQLILKDIVYPSRADKDKFSAYKWELAMELKRDVPGMRIGKPIKGINCDVKIHFRKKWATDYENEVYMKCICEDITYIEGNSKDGRELSLRQHLIEKGLVRKKEKGR